MKQLGILELLEALPRASKFPLLLWTSGASTPPTVDLAVALLLSSLNQSVTVGSRRVLERLSPCLVMLTSQDLSLSMVDLLAHRGASWILNLAACDLSTSLAKQTAESLGALVSNQRSNRKLQSPTLVFTSPQELQQIAPFFLVPEECQPSSAHESRESPTQGGWRKAFRVAHPVMRNQLPVPDHHSRSDQRHRQHRREVGHFKQQVLFAEPGQSVEHFTSSVSSMLSVPEPEMGWAVIALPPNIDPSDPPSRICIANPTWRLDETHPQTDKKIFSPRAHTPPRPDRQSQENVDPVVPYIPFDDHLLGLIGSNNNDPEQRDGVEGRRLAAEASWLSGMPSLVLITWDALPFVQQLCAVLSKAAHAQFEIVRGGNSNESMTVVNIRDELVSAWCGRLAMSRQSGSEGPSRRGVGGGGGGGGSAGAVSAWANPILAVLQTIEAYFSIRSFAHALVQERAGELLTQLAELARTLLPGRSAATVLFRALRCLALLLGSSEAIARTWLSSGAPTVSVNRSQSPAPRHPNQNSSSHSNNSKSPHSPRKGRQPMAAPSSPRSEHKLSSRTLLVPHLVMMVLCSRDNLKVVECGMAALHAVLAWGDGHDVTAGYPVVMNSLTGAVAALSRARSEVIVYDHTGRVSVVHIPGSVPATFLSLLSWAPPNHPLEKVVLKLVLGLATRSTSPGLRLAVGHLRVAYPAQFQSAAVQQFMHALNLPTAPPLVNSVSLMNVALPTALNYVFTPSEVATAKALARKLRTIVILHSNDMDSILITNGLGHSLFNARPRGDLRMMYLLLLAIVTSSSLGFDRPPAAARQVGGPTAWCPLPFSQFETVSPLSPLQSPRNSPRDTEQFDINDNNSNSSSNNRPNVLWTIPLPELVKEATKLFSAICELPTCRRAVDFVDLLHQARRNVF